MHRNKRAMTNRTRGLPPESKRNEVRWSEGRLTDKILGSIAEFLAIAAIVAGGILSRSPREVGCDQAETSDRLPAAVTSPKFKNGA